MDALSEAIVRLLNRQREVDERLARIESALNLPPLESPKPALPPAPPTPPPSPAPKIELAASAPVPTAPAVPEVSAPAKPVLETNIGLTLVNRVGVVTLVLGVGFFFKWAVENQWIGPAGRVLLASIAGLVAIVAADWLWRKGQQVFAQGMTAVGIGILYLAVYAAFGFYHLVPQAPAFVLLTFTTILAVALALRYASVAMAVLGFLGGYLTPLLLSTGEDHPWFLFSYVLLLNAAALFLARRRKWRAPEMLSFFATALIYAVWLVDKFTPEKKLVATLFVLLYYALFSFALGVPLMVLQQLLATVAVNVIWGDSAAAFLALTLLIATAGLVIADLRRLPGISLSAFGVFWIAYTLWSYRHPSLHATGLLFAGLTFATVLFLAWIPWRIGLRRQRAETEDLIILALNASVYFGGSYNLLNPEYHAWMGLFAVAIASVHLALAAWLARRKTDNPPAQLASGIALTLLILAAPIQFTSYRITMAWALEFLALSWIARQARSEGLRYAAMLVSGLVWFRLFLLDSWIYSDPASYQLVDNARFLTFLIAAVCSWLFAHWNQPTLFALIEYIAGHVILLWGLCLEDVDWAARSSAAQNLSSVEAVSISILLAIYAVLLVVLGVATRTAIHRIAGLGLMGFVVAKLYLFDVWQLERVYRIWAFVGLGALLIATSFLYSHFRALIENWWKSDPPTA